MPQTLSKPVVLVAEDESVQRDVLLHNLIADGFSVVGAADGEEVLGRAEEIIPDILILDWMLPKVSGIEVCHRLRAQAKFRAMPIIMLSARAEEVDRVRGLETGADDYVIKPYSVVELMARVRMQLRRARPWTLGTTLEFDNITVDTETYRVFVSGQPVHLGPIEFRLLLTLMEKPGRVWSREQLLDRVWGRDAYVETRTVDVHIGRLRKSIGNAGSNYPVRTVRSAGYSLG